MTVHPVGAIGLTANNNVLDVYEGFPPLTFSPSDCVSLYDSMVKYVDLIGDEKYRQKLLGLKPDTFFQGDLYITKVRATEYEKLLKQQLKAWIVGYNANSKLIDQDLFDIKDQGIGDDADEKLVHEEVEIKKDIKKLSKKERRKLEIAQKEAERKRQRELADLERQRKRDAKKKRKGGKQEKKGQQTKKEEVETKEADSKVTEEEEEVL